ncbi:MAG: hypothetical protein WC701_14105 [Kiritimatiellales bacterium]
MDIMFGLLWAAVLLLALFHFISWLLAAVLTLCVFALGYAIFPYITPFDLVEKGQKHENPPSV